MPRCQLSQRGSKGPRVNQRSRSPVAGAGSVFVRTMYLIFDNVQQSLQVSMASDNVCPWTNERLPKETNDQ